MHLKKLNFRKYAFFPVKNKRRVFCKACIFYKIYLGLRNFSCKDARVSQLEEK